MYMYFFIYIHLDYATVSDLSLQLATLVCKILETSVRIAWGGLSTKGTVESINTMMEVLMMTMTATTLWEELYCQYKISGVFKKIDI